jgi:hypothetical protein
MTVINDADALFYGSQIVDEVYVGPIRVWPFSITLDNIVPPTAPSPPTTAIVDIYGFGFVAGSWVWWLPSTSPPDAAAFGSGTTFRDPTHLTTTIHHLNPGVTYMMWVSTLSTQTGGLLSNRVPFSVTGP